MNENVYATTAHSVEVGRRTYRVRRIVTIMVAVICFLFSGSLVAAGAAGQAKEPTVDPQVGLNEPARPGEAGAVPPATLPEPVEQSLPRTSRLVAQPPDRVVDTRGQDVPAPNTAFQFGVPDGRTAVVLSVSIMNSAQAGWVNVDGNAGKVEAIQVGNSGGTTTNLVAVPVIGTSATISSSAGGHLVVDVVGSFEPRQSVASGRFVSVEPTTITTLETAAEGRQATLPFGRVSGVDTASAVLVEIRADVGRDGGTVLLGSDPNSLGYELMWGPVSGADDERRALVLLQPGADASAYLKYEGGSALSASVVGFFTGEDAEQATAGLYLPSGPRSVFTGVLSSSTPLEIRDVNPDSSAGFVTVGSATAIPGRIGSTVVPINDGALVLRTDADLEVTVTLMGEFL